MQGFNRYIPPDFDPKKHATLNSHQGKKHALGKRAKDIDKGILIVRFELPFNIWCGSCGAHIGAGVRYNAQKRKVGSYFSTPIYAFRCKCHLCSGWFEIRTDPKNAAYVVEEGAKRKDEDWNPEENGGFAAHDTEAPSAADPPADPFNHLEKTIDQQTWAKKNSSRLTELLDASSRLSSDPYVVSSALRRRFREEKKVMLEKQGRDEGLRDRYGIHEEVELGEEEVERGREMWEAGRERRGLAVDAAGVQVGERGMWDDEGEEGYGDGESSMATPRGSVGSGTPVSGSVMKGKGRADGPSPSLAQVLRITTARKYDPFADAADAFLASPAGAVGGVKAKGRVKDPAALAAVSDTAVGTTIQPREVSKVDAVDLICEGGGDGGGPRMGRSTLSGGLLAGYGSD